MLDRVPFGMAGHGETPEKFGRIDGTSYHEAWRWALRAHHLRSKFRRGEESTNDYLSSHLLPSVRGLRTFDDNRVCVSTQQGKASVHRFAARMIHTSARGSQGPPW